VSDGHYQAVIVGGGPAGLSAALVLGRARRRVLLLDSGRYRNEAAHQLRGFISRDGIAPAELRRIARHELGRYPSVELRDAEVVDAVATEPGFQLSLAGGDRVGCQVLLLATGMVDLLPDIPGATELLGQGLHHCPYCDGHEVRDQPLAIYAPASETGVKYALAVARWSRDSIYCVAPGPELAAADRVRLERLGVVVDPRPIRRLVGQDGGVTLEHDDGAPLWRRAMFFHLGARPASDLARRLGCVIDAGGGVEVDRSARTCVPNLFAAGDATRDVLLAIVAAGEGAAAAVLMNAALNAAEDGP
jgi:thioredoxin reductase